MYLMWITISLTMMMALSSYNSPITLVIIIIMQTLNYSMMIWAVNNSFWMSYILILVFIGGMLVIFIYIASLTSNTNFNPINKNKAKLILMVMIFTLVLAFTKSETMKPSTSMSSVKLGINDMYNENFAATTIFLAVYLLVTLFILVKMSKKFKGPLKPK